MNLFCFSLEGSMDNLYEPVQDPPTDEDCRFSSMTKEISMRRGSELPTAVGPSLVCRSNFKKNKEKSSVLKSTLDSKPAGMEKKLHKPNFQMWEEKVWQKDRDRHEVDHIFQLVNKENWMLITWGQPNIWMQGVEVVANGESQEPGETLLKTQNLVQAKKGIHRGSEKQQVSYCVGGPTINFVKTDDDSSAMSCIGLTKKAEKTEKESILTTQVTAMVSGGCEVTWSQGLYTARSPNSCHVHNYSTLCKHVMPWDNFIPFTCYQPPTNNIPCSHNSAQPTTSTNWDFLPPQRAAVPSPWVVCPITQRNIYESQRSTSFGRFDAFRHSSPAKTDENVANQHADNEPETEGDQHKSGAIGKKMKAISMTMRKRMGRKYTKALSEEMVEDVDRDHDTDSGEHTLRTSVRRSSNSLDSLYSNQSLSSGITSGSDGSSVRNSLQLEEAFPYTGHFCGRARVHTDFVPSPYDTDSLKLKVGDIIDVISKPPMGIWTGVLHNKVGNFKFIYVDLLEEEPEPQKERSHRRSNLPAPKTLQELLINLHLEEYTSTLLLNGYQTLEDLRELKEKHLVELNMSDPEHRHLLLSAAGCLDDPEDDTQAGDGEEGYTDCEESQKLKQNCPRDSGCYVTPEGSENGRDDVDNRALSADSSLAET